jgi:hypothetical protein
MARTKSVRRRFYRFFQHVELDGAMTARGTTPAKNNAIKIRVASNARMTSTRLASTFGRGAFSRAAPANLARCKRFDLALAGIAVDKSVHGVAFLSWNQHPEPTSSR